MSDFSERLDHLRSVFHQIEAVTDVEGLTARIAALTEESSAPGLWDDTARAQEVTSKLSHAQSELEKLETMRARIEDAGALLEIAQEEELSDPASARELYEALGEEMTSTEKALEELHIRTLLSGKYDERDAVVTIRSGAGGVDAADFAQMLQRMYLRWAERSGYATETNDRRCRDKGRPVRQSHDNGVYFSSA